MYNLTGQKQLTCTSSQSTLIVPASQCLTARSATPAAQSCAYPVNCRILWLSFVHLNVKSNIQMVAVVVDIYPCFWFNFIRILRHLEHLACVWGSLMTYWWCWYMSQVHKDGAFQVWCLYVFVLFLFLFYISLHPHKVSKFQRAFLPDGTEVEMRQDFICCWI